MCPHKYTNIYSTCSFYHSNQRLQAKDMVENVEDMHLLSYTVLGIKVKRGRHCSKWITHIKIYVINSPNNSETGIILIIPILQVRSLKLREAGKGTHGYLWFRAVEVWVQATWPQGFYAFHPSILPHKEQAGRWANSNTLSELLSLFYTWESSISSRLY